MTEEVLEGEDFESVIDHIEVMGQNTLTYFFKDGTEMEKHWLSTTPNKKLREKLNGNNSNADSGN